MNELFAGILAVAIAAIAAYVLARVLVELADLLGLEWNEGREAKRHRDDGHEPPPAPRRSGPYRLDLADPRLRQAIRDAETHRTPLADRVRAQRARRLVEVTGGR
jgi:hypothetical protein